MSHALANRTLFHQSLSFIFPRSLVRFWRTRERVCFNVYRSSVARCWDTVSKPVLIAVRLIQWTQLKQSILFINECSHPKTSLTRERTRLTSPEAQAAAVSIKGLTRFRQSFIFSSSLKKTKGGSTCRVLTDQRSYKA